MDFQNLIKRYMDNQVSASEIRELVRLLNTGQFDEEITIIVSEAFEEAGSSDDLGEITEAESRKIIQLILGNTEIQD